MIPRYDLELRDPPCRPRLRRIVESIIFLESNHHLRLHTKPNNNNSSNNNMGLYITQIYIPLFPLMKSVKTTPMLPVPYREVPCREKISPPPPSLEAAATCIIIIITVLYLPVGVRGAAVVVVAKAVAGSDSMCT